MAGTESFRHSGRSNLTEDTVLAVHGDAGFPDAAGDDGVDLARLHQQP
ncbi:hypothetical protein ACQEVZ_31625 [Dactylosporangium sp. CA-152071]